MGSADSLVAARPVAVLLVHLDRDRRAGVDGTLAADGAGVGVASNVVGRDVCHGRVGQRETRALRSVDCEITVRFGFIFPPL